MKRHILGLALLVSLSLIPSAHGQVLWRWFGPKTPDKAAPTKAPLPDGRRATEVNVEIAWLADPATFPYYLEAHATADQLEVRGYVPNRSVREHAIKIAQVYTATPVVDALKEHPSLLVRPSLMPAAQLQNSAQSALKVALPKQAGQLKIEVAADGKVSVLGPVNSYEEKIAVSHALRRLHGCTSVRNLTVLPSEMLASSSNLPGRTPIVKTSGAPPIRDAAAPRPWSLPLPKGPTTSEEPPIQVTMRPQIEKQTPLEPPIEIPQVTPEPTPVKVEPMPVKPEPIPVKVEPMPVKPEPVPVKVEPPMKTPLGSAAELQKRVKAAWPDATGATVEILSATEVRITLEIRDEKELSPAAERIFAIPELQDARLDLQFKIGTP